MPYHLAQVNVGIGRGPIDSPVMKEFKDALDEINALAEASSGFVWRLKGDSGNATEIQAFPDPRQLVNLSVWESVEALQAYVFKSVHGKFFKRRGEWFEKMATPHLALWWVPAGTVPTVEDAKARLALIEARGETAEAFTFRKPFPPPPG